MLKDFCRTSGGLRAMLLLNIVVRLIFVIVPLVIIVTSIISLVNVIKGNSQDELGKFIWTFIRKVVAGIIVFLIPTMITFFFTNLTNENFYDLKVCIERATLSEVKYFEDYYEPAEAIVSTLENNPSKASVNDVRNQILSMSNLRGEDKEDFLARIDAAESKTDEFAKIIKCKNDGGMWVDNKCKIEVIQNPHDNGNGNGNSDVNDGTTGENGEYYYQGNGNDGGTIDYNGYDVVQTAISVNDYLKIVAKNRIGQNNDSSIYGGYCLAFYYIHAYSLYSGNTSARAPDAKNYLYAGKFKTYIDSKEKVLAVTYNEIKKGRPVIIQVNGNKAGTSRHFVTVVGVKKGVTESTIKETDLLIIDSWDGKLEQMNGKGSGTRFLTSGADCHKDYSGYRIQYLK